MKMISVAVLMLSTCALAADGGVDDSGQLRLMTFNIRFGTAADGDHHWDKRKELVLGVFKDHAPDIVGMQEALQFQTAYIRKAFPFYREIGGGRLDGMEKGEYVPILYDARRFYCGESGTFWLSETPDLPGTTHWGNQIPRIATWGRFIDKKTGHKFYLYNTHLDHINQKSRDEGVRLIVDRIAMRSHPDPVLMTGDMNANDDNSAMLYLFGSGAGCDKSDVEKVARPAFLDAHRMVNAEIENESTVNGFQGWVKGKKIDYVLVMKGDQRAEVIEAAILRDNDNGRYPSDHYPVQAVLKWPAVGK